MVGWKWISETNSFDINDDDEEASEFDVNELVSRSFGESVRRLSEKSLNKEERFGRQQTPSYLKMKSKGLWPKVDTCASEREQVMKIHEEKLKMKKRHYEEEDLEKQFAAALRCFLTQI
uniref:Uncharacterized protein n=1 Tax=Chenopodium quinoa TaxID=63459 RepID=A0A803KNK7_CHEQI